MTAAETDEPVPLGQAMWGRLLSAPYRRRCDRLIPAEHLTGDHRAALAARRERARFPGIAPLLAAEGTEVVRDDDGRFNDIVRYEVSIDGTLGQAIDGARPADRLAAVAMALRALPGWWQRVEGMLPGEADIVFSHGNVFLLELPAWGAPPLAALMEVRERIPYLAPEIVRGDGGPDRASDLYALVVMALRCFVELPSAEPGRMLHWAASGSLDELPSRLPLWARDVSAVRDTLSYLRGVLALGREERAVLDPAEVADRLDRCREAMNPLVAVRQIRETGNPEGALHLAYTIRLTEPSYELLVLAGELAYRHLHTPQPMEAWDLLEQAVQLEPGRREAYLAQFDLVNRFARRLAKQLSEAIDPSFAERMDATILRAFEHLPPEGKDERTHELVVYLLSRGRANLANEVIYGRLMRDDRLHWWLFDLMVDYARSFMALGRHRDAAQIAETARLGLIKVRENRSMSDEKIHGYGRKLSELQRDLHDHRQARAEDDA
ncbi:hypothetical protein [Nonomuraea sp. NPDC050310]|uniref:hypothetical protein n=1 Tax=unclassified Nonomuraea TaxID=2593643 RepID=UPI00340DB904